MSTPGGEPRDRDEVDEERVNRVAGLRSLLFAGTLQNPELTFFPAPVDR